MAIGPQVLAGTATGDRVLRAVFGDAAHAEDAALEARRLLVVRAILAIAAASVLLSLAHATTAPPFQPPDEMAHVSYALAVGDGELPTIYDFPDASRIPGMREGISQFAATHPPLVYAVLAVPLRLGELLGAPLAGLWAARVIIALSAGVGYLLVGWLAVALLPERLSAAVTATGIAALIPYHVHIGGIIYNDAPAFALITAILLGAVLVLRRGITRPRLVTLTLVAMAAANSRAVGAAAAALAAGAAGLAALLHGDGRVAARVRQGILAGACVGGLAFLSSIWFYALNWTRYASPTGAAQLMEVHGRQPMQQSTLQLLVDRGFWRGVHSQLWGRVETYAQGNYLPDPPLIASRGVVTVLVLAAVVAGVWRLAGGSWRRPLPVVAAWVVLGTWFSALLVAMLGFVQSGGGPHARYLWPAIWLVTVVLALGLAALPGGRRGVPAVVFGAWLVVANGIVLARFTFRPDVPGEGAPLRDLAAAAPGAATAVLAVVLLVTAALAAVWCRGIWLLAPGDARWPVAAPTAGPGLSLPVPGGTSASLSTVDVALAAVLGMGAIGLVVRQHGWGLPALAAAGVTGLVLAVGAAVAADRRRSRVAAPRRLP